MRNLRTTSAFSLREKLLIGLLGSVLFFSFQVGYSAVENSKVDQIVQMIVNGGGQFTSPADKSNYYTRVHNGLVDAIDLLSQVNIKIAVLAGMSPSIGTGSGNCTTSSSGCPVLTGTTLSGAPDIRLTTNYPITDRGYCRDEKDTIVDVPWPGAGGQIRPSTAGLKRSTIAYRIRIPATIPETVLRKSNTDFTTTGFFHIAETPGSQVTDHMTSISKKPCDYTESALTIGIGNTAPGMNFAISKNLPYFTKDGFGATQDIINFYPGEIIYVNVSHDLTGYGPVKDKSSGFIATNRKTCNTDEGIVDRCDILFDFAIPNRGRGFTDTKPDGTPWPLQTNTNDRYYGSGWPILSDEYMTAHPLQMCRITYSIGSDGTANILTERQDLYQTSATSSTGQSTTDIVYGKCPGASAIEAVILQQRSN